MMGSIYRRHESGLSLLEFLLVLMIAVALIIMGFRQYQVLKTDSDIRKVQANVDTLFQAAAWYYQANCDQKTSTDTIVPAALNPNASPAPPNPYIMWTSSTLCEVTNTTEQATFKKFLTSELLFSPIADSYCVKFIRHDSSRTMKTWDDSSKRMGTIVIWSIQVIVKLKDPTQADFYFRLLRGNCLATSSSSSSSCSGLGTGNLIVFERLPSFAAAQNQTTYWLMNPLVKQFNQMYTTYPGLYLMSTGDENTGGKIPGGEQYFLCGG